MSSFMNSAVGYSEGAVNVMMYDWNKIFLPGDRIKIKIKSQMKLTKVSYCWDNEEEMDVKIFFNHCWFKVCMPKVVGNQPSLKIITEVQFKDGTLLKHEHDFQINNMY